MLCLAAAAVAVLLLLRRRAALAHQLSWGDDPEHGGDGDIGLVGALLYILH